MPRVLLLTAVLASIVAACGGGDDGSASPTVPTKKPTVATTAPAPKPVSKNGPAALILRDAPSRFVLQPDRLTDTGSVDFDKAVRDDVAANGEVALRNAGFVDGYQRTWTSVGGLDRNTVLLYRFRTPAGASGYGDHWVATLTAPGAGVNAKVFEPPLIADGIGVTATYAGTTTAVVVATRGNYAVQAVAEGASGTNQENVAAALAGAQLARLPA